MTTAEATRRESIEDAWRHCQKNNRAVFGGLSAGERETARRTFYAGALSAMLLLDADLGSAERSADGDNKPLRRLINRRITEANSLIMLSIPSPLAGEG